MSHDYAPKPGPEHEWFRDQVGDWDATISTTIQPGAPPFEWKGTCQVSLGCGGLWCIMKFAGQMGEVTFTGHGVCGFDAQKKQYVQCWVDSMSSSLLLLAGHVNKEKREMVMHGEMLTPMGPAKMRQTTRMVAKNEMLFTIEAPTQDGGYFTMMKVNYRRR